MIFSLSQKDTHTLQRIARAPRPDLPIVPRTPKKTHLERLPLSETTSVVMRAIRRVPVERLHEYFEQSCDRHPHETAVISGSSQLTYQELDQWANRLAHFLISRGIREGNPVGILLERSLDTYIALLGVLKAGAAFVPLDPSLPADQVAFIAHDADLRTIVTTSTFYEKTTILSCSVLELDQAYEALSVQYDTRPQVRVAPASLSHIIYKFGTAGQPEGVVFSHANIVNFLRVITSIFRVTRDDRVYQHMSIASDLSFEVIWPTWIAGATLIANPTAFQYSGHEFTEFLIKYKITVLCCIPAQLAAIERDVPSLRSLFVGGEVCPAYLVSRWACAGRRMLNTYGCTETTVTATWCEMFPGRPVTIGTPLPTYHAYILDNRLSPVKDGEVGELFIGGPGVAMGYLNRPDLTKECFISNPILHDRELMPRLYRTGDFGRITPAGEIEYLGQFSTQVRTQDGRIEVGKVEQIVPIHTNTPPLNEFVSAPQFEAGVIPECEAKVSKLSMLKQMSIKSIYQKIMTDPLYKNSIFNMASTFILGGLGFVFWIIIARLYKPENVGIATTLISIMTLLNSLTVMGLNSSLNRYLPKSTHKSELINSSFVIVTVVTLIACAIFLLGLPIFSPQLLFLQSNIFYVISFTLFVIFCSWNMLVESTFIALRATGNIFIKNTIIGLLKLVLPFILIAFGSYGVFASNSLAFALGVFAGLMILILHFKIRPSISVNISLIKETLVYSFANYMVGFMFSMPSLVLPVIILNILSAKYAAYYYLASMIQNVLQIIPLAAAQSLLIEGSYNEAELKKHVKKAITTILIILIPATAIVVFGGKTLLQFFGKSYATEALPFLQLYSVSTIFTSLLLISNAIMNVKRKIKSLVFSNVLASVLTLWLSYAFISSKLVGIGWGWMLGQVIAGLISIFFIVCNVYR